MKQLDAGSHATPGAFSSLPSCISHINSDQIQSGPLRRFMWIYAHGWKGMNQSACAWKNWACACLCMCVSICTIHVAHSVCVSLGVCVCVCVDQIIHDSQHCKTLPVRQIGLMKHFHSCVTGGESITLLISQSGFAPHHARLQAPSLLGLSSRRRKFGISAAFHIYMEAKREQQALKRSFLLT